MMFFAKLEQVLKPIHVENMGIILVYFEFKQRLTITATDLLFQLL